MATLIRKRTSKYWHAQFTVPLEGGGVKKINRTTGKTNRRDAFLAAADLERAALNEAGAGDDKGRKILSIITRATEDAQKGILNATRGREYINEIVSISTGEELQAYTIQEWIDEWMARQEGVSEATTRAYTTYTRQFTKWLGSRGSGTLQSLTTEDMRKLREWYRNGAGTARIATANTASQKMKVVSSIFIEAMKQGITNFNPVSALKPLAQDDSLPRQPFTSEEVGKLVDHAPSEEWKGLILMGAFTGLRLTDCAQLTWNSINLEKKEIVTMPKKTKRKKTIVRIPIHPTLEIFLKTLPTPIKSDTPVFQSLANQAGTGRSGLSTQFTCIMADAKVSRGKSISPGGRTSYERSFHSLRHTLTSWLADSNVSPEIRMQIIGHKSQDVHSLYTHLGDETLRNAMAGVPGL